MKQIKQFEVGKTYSMRSICDSNCIWSYIVISRTERTVVLQQLRNGEPFGDKERFVIKKKLSEMRGVESCMPTGTYSMAPILSADNN